MQTSFFPLGLGLILLLLACNFDDDAEFQVQTQAIYFLTEGTEEKSVTRVTNSGVESNWESSLGLEGNAISGIAGRGDRLWIALEEQQSILEIDAGSGQILERYSTDPVSPSSLGIGDEYVLVSDSMNNQIAFLNKKNGEWIIRGNVSRPGQIVYRSALFFVVSDQTKVGIWDARAFALTQEVSIGRSIFNIQNDNRFFTYVFSGKDTVFRSRIDYTTRNASEAPERVRFKKILFSPFRTADFGTEWLEPITLSPDQTLSAGPTGQIDDFEVDFFSSNLYYQRNDSLFRFGLGTASNEYLAPMSGKFCRAFYYTDFIGN